MANMVGYMLVCLLFAIVVQSAPSITIRPQVMSVPVGWDSDYFFVEANMQPEETVQISFREVDQTGSVIQNPSLDIVGFGVGATGTNTLGTAAQAFSFRVKSATTGTFYINILNTTASEFVLPSPYAIVQVIRRVITIEPVANAFMTMGLPTAPYKVSIDYPSTGSLTLTPSTTDTGYLGNSTIKITPAPIVIPAGSLSASFVFLLPETVVLPSITFTWTVTGNEATLYTDQANLQQTFVLGSSQREFNVLFADSSTNAVVGQSGNYFFYAYTNQLPNTSVSLTPQAADTTFSPSTFTFNNQQQAVRFTFTTTSPDTQKMVNFYLTQTPGENFYVQPQTLYVNVPKRNVYITVSQGGNFVLGNRTFVTVSIVTPVASSLTVTMAAAQVTFNQSSVTFTGNQTSQLVAINPTNIGADQISFYLSGADAAYYNLIAPVGISISGGYFTSTTNYYTPTLYVGQESPEIPIRCSISPISDMGVTVTPYADFIQFSPSSMTFRNGSEQAYFTATPLYTDDPSDDVTRTVSFFLTGPDAPWFSTPASFSITVKRRFVEVHWSPHLLNTRNVNNENRYAQRHLGKTYKVWVTANYVGEGDTFSLTPSSPYYSFDPQVINFDQDNTRQLLSVTVTGTASGQTISYMIGGAAGGWYVPPSDPYAMNNAIRPLAIERYQVSPDTRLQHKKAAVVDKYFDGLSNVPNVNQQNYFNLGHLVSYNVISFVIRSYVLPDGGITITPNCPHATFSPSSISLHGGDATEIIDSQANPIGASKVRNPNFWSLYPNVAGLSFQYEMNNTGLYIEANFTVHPQAGGLHLVTFELSGDDKGFYARPPDQLMYFGVVERDDDEPTQNSAGFVTPSIVTLVIAAVYALFL